MEMSGVFSCKVNSLSFEWLCTRTRFEPEANSNSEMGYSVLAKRSLVCRRFGQHQGQRKRERWAKFCMALLKQEYPTKPLHKKPLCRLLRAGWQKKKSRVGASWELTLAAYVSLGYEKHCSWLTKKVKIFFSWLRLCSLSRLKFVHRRKAFSSSSNDAINWTDL